MLKSHGGDQGRLIDTLNAKRDNGATDLKDPGLVPAKLLEPQPLRGRNARPIRRDVTRERSPFAPWVCWGFS